MTKDPKAMSKKELKDYINKDGFFFHVQCDRIKTDEIANILADAANTSASVKKTGKEMPSGQNIVAFRGIASQNYGKGEKSRNGYKYDQNGWDFTAYFNNPIILWQHDAPYGGIGNAIAFWWDGAGNLNTLFFVDLDTLEDRNATQVERGYVTAISTGAIPKEYAYEDNDTGERMTEAEAEEKFGWENVWRAYFGMSEFITLVVTKAEMIENSLVTIGSNQNAIALQNAIGGHFTKLADEYKAKHATDAVDEVEEDGDIPIGEGKVAKEEEATPNAETTEEETDNEGDAGESEETEDEGADNAEDEAENAEVAEETETEATTDPNEVENSGEIPSPAETAGGENGGNESPGETSQTDSVALEKIAKLEDEVKQLKADNATSLADAKAELQAFKDEVCDAFKSFIDSHNGNVDRIEAITSALKNQRISKGLPHIKQNEPEAKREDQISRIAKQIKGIA